VAFDSVPIRRIQIMRQLSADGEATAQHVIQQRLNISENSLKYQLDELSALNIVEVISSIPSPNQVRIHPNFIGLWIEALGTVSLTTSIPPSRVVEENKDFRGVL
jgi:DNA-binding Lrp family transcriptional regulator